MHMAPRAAAWVAWVVWTCNTCLAGYVERERASVRSFFWARLRGGVRVWSARRSMNDKESPAGSRPQQSRCSCEPS
jgi:hypothetical protein